MPGRAALITRGEAIAVLAGEILHPSGKGRGGYWRWYQRLERERQTGRLEAHGAPGRRGVYFERRAIERLAAELAAAGVTTPGSRRRARAATRKRAQSRGLVPLGDAAARLGITAASLRWRVSRGTIEAVYVDRQLFFTEGALAQARPARAPAVAERIPVVCDLDGCEKERLLTASQLRASKRHFCCDEHRIAWLSSESHAGRITRKGSPDGPEGRRRKSDAMKRSWAAGERDREQIRQLGNAAENGNHWTRKQTTFVDGIDKMTRKRYGHGLSPAHRRALAGQFLSRRQQTSAAAAEARAQADRAVELHRLGHGIPEIASELQVAVRTVKGYLRDRGRSEGSPGRREAKQRWRIERYLAARGGSEERRSLQRALGLSSEELSIRLKELGAEEYIVHGRAYVRVSTIRATLSRAA